MMEECGEGDPVPGPMLQGPQHPQCMQPQVLRDDKAMAVCRVCGGLLLLQVGQRERNWRKNEGERLLYKLEARRRDLHLMIQHRTQQEVLRFLKSKLAF